MIRRMVELFANSGDLDQTLHSVAYDLGQHCLPVSCLGVSSLQWVKVKQDVSRSVMISNVQRSFSYQRCLVVSFCLSVLFRVYKLSLHWKYSATTLTLSTLWVLPDKLLVIFSYFSPNIGFDLSCKLSPLHEVSKPIFLRKKNKNKKIVQIVVW